MHIKLSKHLTISTLLLCCLVLACKDDESSPISETSTPVILNPSMIEWDLRIDKDSIFKVKISNGVPPYYIADRPLFSSKSYIIKDTLYITPKDPRFDTDEFETGDDLITISDNGDNLKTLAIKVRPDYFEYQTTSYVDIKISGDTSFSFAPVFVSSNPAYSTIAFYDKHLEVSNIDLEELNTRLFLIIAQLGSRTNKDTLFNLAIILRDTTQQPFKHINFSPTNPDAIKVTDATPSEINVTFNNLNLVDKNNIFIGNAKLNGSISIQK